ncbi:MAG: MFS transporter [Acidimicrobiales bacterium]|nr:MFS transporter [Acidimicrobiales bacterium]
MSQTATIDRRSAVVAGFLVVVTLMVAIVGSGNLKWFDAALIGYLFGTLFAVFGVAYRYLVWLQRPPTARLNRRGWEAFRQKGRRGANAVALPGLVANNLLAQNFIRKRSTARWFAHQLVFWGCILAALVTFPLVLGLLHFESVGDHGRRYEAYAGPLATIQFDSRSILGWLMFHALDISAVLVLGGVFIFLSRRLRDPGALAVERSNDFLPLAGLFAVSVTGLALTASNLWMEGRFYIFLNTVHALTVTLGLMYIPFGKLFHIFQRPANLGVAYYKKAGEAGTQQECARCGEPFASKLQMDDLKDVLPQVGFDYSLAPAAAGEGSGNYQDNCPQCRRALVTIAQSRRVGGFG